MPGGHDGDVRIVEADVADLYDEMRSAAGDRDVWIVGGGDVASQVRRPGGSWPRCR